MENTTKPTKTASPQRSKNMSSGKAALVIAILASLIAIIAIVISVLNWQQSAKFPKDLKSEVSGFTQSLNNKNAALTAELKSVQAQSQQNQAALTKIQSHLARFLNMVKNRDQQLALSESSYLIHLANLHLNVGQDASTTAELLQSAVNRLQKIDDPELFTLKRALGKDIKQLDQVKTPNPTTIILKLDSINTEIQNLPIQPLKFKAANGTQNQENVSTQKNQQSWYDKFKTGLSGLKDLVIIRHTKKPVVPLLSPTEQFLLKENIQIKLLQAQWAVLHKNPDIYKQSLETVQNWLKTYFREPKEVTDINKQISQLLDINIKPKLPSIKNSIDALQQAIADQLNVQLPIQNDSIQSTPTKSATTPSHQNKETPTTKKQEDQNQQKPTSKMDEANPGVAV